MHLWGILSSLAVSFSSISGTTYPARAFQTSLGQSSAFQASLGHSILHGCELFNQLWNDLSCMAVSFSSISGASYPARLSAFHPFLKLLKHLWGSISCRAKFSSISGILSCMAVSSAAIPGTTLGFWGISGASYLAWLSHRFELFKHPSNTYPAGLSAFQRSLGHPILHSCELFDQFWNNLSCMVVSFSTISGTTYAAWLSAFQASLDSGHLIVHGCELFKHVWNNLSCMAVSFSNISGHPILHGCEFFSHLCCMAASFSSISGTSYPALMCAFQPSLAQP